MTQSMAASDSRPPSRLVRITVGASNAASKFKSVNGVPGQVGAEGVGQQLAEAARPGRMVDQQLGAAVLQQHLAASPARHQQGPAPVDAGQRDQPAAAGRV